MPKVHYSDQTPKSLEAMAEKLERIAAALRHTASDMRAASVTVMSTPNMKTFIRGVGYIERFEHAAAIALTNLLHEREREKESG